jgi:endonuclease G
MTTKFLRKTILFLTLLAAVLCVSQTFLSRTGAVPQTPGNATTPTTVSVTVAYPPLLGTLNRARQGEGSPLEIPVCPQNANPQQNVPDHEIHEYTAFTLCYRESYELSEWVAYELTREELAVNVSRSNNFRKDPSITTGSAETADYYKSGYDRGHLAPAADMRFDATAMSESFFMSNMAPQTAELNRGAWKYAEDETRRIAEKYGRVWVVSGPVLDRADFKTIGANKVSVPDYFYKALLFPVDNDDGFAALAFIMPNENPSRRYLDYCVSIDEIEARTGLDLFSALDDDIEETIESVVTGAYAVR